MLCAHLLPIEVARDDLSEVSEIGRNVQCKSMVGDPAPQIGPGADTGAIGPGRGQTAKTRDGCRNGELEDVHEVWEMQLLMRAHPVRLGVRTLWV